MFKWIVFASATLALAVGGAWAQQPQMVRVAGTVESFDGHVLAIKSDKLGAVKVNLTTDAAVFGVSKATIADIKPGADIGAMPQPDGSIQAFSIHLFLPAQRGVVPDRYGPWDARPNSTMTNAYVENVVTGKDGDTLMVKYKDGEKKIIVTKDTVLSLIHISEPTRLG